MGSISQKPYSGVGGNRESTSFAFIVGSPRSGTTVLGQILNNHNQISHWYEPYFIWDYHIDYLDTDVRTADHLTGRHRRFIRAEFERFLRRSGARVLVEKTPENSFRIPFVHAVFPEGKWIHLIRDGRAATCSIHREWMKRKQIVKHHSITDFLRISIRMLSRHPFWRNRLQAVWFELKNLSSFDPRRLFNKSKWRGEIGWGPRFPGWREAFKQHTLLQFNAMQWLTCVETVMADSGIIAPKNFLEIRYEDLIMAPNSQFKRVFDFLGVPSSEREIWGDLNASSLDKWKKEFNADQINEIGLIINSMLKKLGYVNEHPESYRGEPHRLHKMRESSKQDYSLKKAGRIAS